MDKNTFDTYRADRNALANDALELVQRMAGFLGSPDPSEDLTALHRCYADAIRELGNR